MAPRPVRVEIAAPFASTPGEPTLDMSFPTTPGFSSGAGISQQTARDLIRELQAALDEIAGRDEMTERRLTKTAVEEAIHETKTKPFVDEVGSTVKHDDGSREVTVTLRDVLDEPRDSPAGADLIGRLESDGWTVVHRRLVWCSWLIVSEPVVSPDSSLNEKG